MNEKVTIFKPDDITIKLGENEYRLYFDLNAFVELEKIYESVDVILQMILGADGVPDTTDVKYLGSPVDAKDISIEDVPLLAYLTKLTRPRQAKYTDTLNLLWAGCLHDAAIYNNFGEITGYTITKARLGSVVTFKNLRELNSKIIFSLLRDMLPQDEKNAEAPVEQEVPQTDQPTQLKLHK